VAEGFATGAPDDVALAAQRAALGDLLASMVSAIPSAPITFETGDLSASPATSVTLDPPALLVQSVRGVKHSDASEVNYVLTDKGGTAAGAVASLSADGTTITVGDPVDQLVVLYVPRPTAAPDASALAAPLRPRSPR